MPRIDTSKLVEIIKPFEFKKDDSGNDIIEYNENIKYRRECFIKEINSDIPETSFYPEISTTLTFLEKYISNEGNYLDDSLLSMYIRRKCSIVVDRKVKKEESKRKNKDINKAYIEIKMFLDYAYQYRNAYERVMNLKYYRDIFEKSRSSEYITKYGYQTVMELRKRLDKQDPVNKIELELALGISLSNTIYIELQKYKKDSELTLEIVGKYLLIGKLLAKINLVFLRNILAQYIFRELYCFDFSKSTMEKVDKFLNENIKNINKKGEEYIENWEMPIVNEIGIITRGKKRKKILKVVERHILDTLKIYLYDDSIKGIMEKAEKQSLNCSKKIIPIKKIKTATGITDINLYALIHKEIMEEIANQRIQDA